MTTKPSYVIHEVTEKDVTVDWFFGSGRVRTKVVQGICVLVSWFFLVLPVVITASALLHRDSAGGWWSFQEGFEFWDRSMSILAVMVVLFAIGFLVLHLAHRITSARRDRRRTYDEHRLAVRLEIAEGWYADKFGPEALRHGQRKVEIQPYGDIETHELRGLYRTNGVD